MTSSTGTLFEQLLTFVPARTIKITAPVVSPEMIRSALARRISGTETPAIAEFLARIESELFDWYAVRWPSRMEAISLFFEGLTSEQVALRVHVTDRTVRRWRESFEYIASEVLTNRIRRERFEDWTNAYCDLTHRASGGSGGTPFIGRREFMAKNCPACAARQA